MSSSLSSSPSLSSSSRRRAQRTLVEQAHLLPDDLLSEDRFLRHPIPSRIRVAPNSEPQILMQQLDNVDGWKPLKVAYPTFPEDYPPKPLLLDFDTLRTVFTTGENAAFEWLGDAMIGAAQALCIHRSTVTSDSKPLRSETITGTLVTEPFLAHLALLYGLQLHDYCARTGTGSIPSMERTCDVFESYVGAAALHCGVVDTLAWLEILFSPWVLKFCATDEMLPPTMLSRAVRLKLDAWTRKAPGAAVVELEPLRIETREFAAGAGNLVALPLASSEDARALLGNALPTWPHVDLSTVQLPDNYPPPPPALSTAHLQQLTDAMTDVFCQIYFGAHVGSNQRYSIVGKRIYWLAVTKLSMEKLPTATPAELDEVRVECTGHEVTSRLALVLNLHRHLRLLRRADDNMSLVSAQQCTEAFYALLAVIHLHAGWDPLNEWLNVFITPWIIAAGNATLRVSPAAQKLRDNRRQLKMKNQAKTERDAAEDKHRIDESHRDRYLAAVPKLRRRTGKNIQQAMSSTADPRKYTQMPDRRIS